MQALSAATHHYRQRRDGAALGRFIAADGLVGARALYALRPAEHTDEIAMVMPLVLERLSNADVAICLAAVGLLTKYRLLAREWEAISDLLDGDTETVRLSVLAALDDLWDAKYDLAPVASWLLRAFARKGGDYSKTRGAAASSSGSIHQSNTCAMSFVLNGVHLMRIAEVRAQLTSLKRVAAEQEREG